MWIMTNFGFFSATERTDKKPAALIAAGDNRTLQVRVRDLSHLEALRVFMGDALGPTIEIPNRDYQARAYCTPEAWGRALYEMSMEIDYPNFKSSVKETKLHNAYMKVWSAMADAYGTGYSKGGSYAWTDYASTGTSKYGTGTSSYPMADHAWEEDPKRKSWCAVLVNGKVCSAFKQDHATPGKRGSKRGKGKDGAQPEKNWWDDAAGKYDQPKALTASASDDDDMAGVMARVAEGLDRLGYSDADLAKMDDDDVQELLLTAADAENILDDVEGDESTDTMLSLHAASKKVGVSTKELRDWMLNKPEWASYKESNGFSWLIPASEIEELDFQFWKSEPPTTVLG